MQLQLHIPVKILSLKTEWRLNDEKCHFLRLFFMFMLLDKDRDHVMLMHDIVFFLLDWLRSCYLSTECQCDHAPVVLLSTY